MVQIMPCDASGPIDGLLGDCVEEKNANTFRSKELVEKLRKEHAKNGDPGSGCAASLEKVEFENVGSRIDVLPVKNEEDDQISPFINCSNVLSSPSSIHMSEQKQCGDDEGSQHQNNTQLRRCLQFGVDKLKPAVGGDRTGIQESSISLSAGLSSSQEPINPPKCTDNVSGSHIGGNFPLAVSKPRGIGLHLNSLIKAEPVTSKQSLKKALGVKGKIVASYQLAGEVKVSMPANFGSNNSASLDNETNENVACTTSTSSKLSSPDTMLPSDPLATLKPSDDLVSSRDKRKSDSELAESIKDLDPVSPKNKRKKASSRTDSNGCKRCNCKKTKCLKLYCDCFAAGLHCTEYCTCQGCLNRPEYEDMVVEARQQIESRNPHAFAPRVVQQNVSPSQSGEVGNCSTPSSARHKKGCNCKKSMCIKKYCECYQANVGCSAGCRCEECRNIYGRRQDYGITSELSKSAAEGASESMLDEKKGAVAFRGDLPAIQVHNLPELSPVTPGLQYSDHCKNTFKSQITFRRIMLSPDCNHTVSSSYGNHSASTRTLHGPSILSEETTQESVNVFSDDAGNGRENSEDPLPISMIPSAASKPRDLTNIPHPIPSPLSWHSSPITPMTQFSGPKHLHDLGSSINFSDILEDDTPDILKDSTPVRLVKVRSPYKKRVSPPRHHFLDLGSSSTRGLKSSRRYILQAVPPKQLFSAKCSNSSSTVIKTESPDS